MFSKKSKGERKPYFGMTGGWLTFWVSVACSTDMTLFGYDQGVFGGVNVTPDYLNTLSLDPKGVTLSTITAIYDIGCFFGAIAAASIGEKLGRKKTILVGTTIMSIGAILQATAYSVPHMIVARIIAGIGNGLNTSTAPLWQSETSKASMRGKLVVIEMICNIAGFSLSNWITYGFSFLDGPVTWRFPIAFQFIFIFVLYGTVPWLPESPRWLVMHDKLEEAEQILADLESSTVDDPYIIAQFKEVQWVCQQEKENTIRWGDLLRGKTGGQAGSCTIRRLILGAGTQAMQQFAGINVTSYYLPTVLIQSVGLDENLARLLAACNSVSYLFFGSLAVPVVEKLGRRFLMIFGAAGQCFCYLMITILLRYAALYNGATKEQLGSAAVAFFFLYYVFFGFGWQGVPWLYPTEINSTGMRTKGAAIGTATNWIVNFMVVEITPPGIASLGWQFYIIWTVFNFSFIPIVYLFYPETANRTLEDMDKYFLDQPPLFVFREKDAISSKRPLKYVEHEQGEVRRHSTLGSISLSTQRRRSSAGYSPEDPEKNGSTHEAYSKADDV